MFSHFDIMWYFCCHCCCHWFVSVTFDVAVVVIVVISLYVAVAVAIEFDIAVPVGYFNFRNSLINNLRTVITINIIAYVTGTTVNHTKYVICFDFCYHWGRWWLWWWLIYITYIVDGSMIGTVFWPCLQIPLKVGMRETSKIKLVSIRKGWPL